MVDGRECTTGEREASEHMVVLVDCPLLSVGEFHPSGKVSA